MTLDWTARGNPLLTLIGWTETDKTYVPVLEDNFVKFMSDHGVEDEAQGDAFERWLNERGARYERVTGRSFTVDRRTAAFLNETWPAG